MKRYLALVVVFASIVMATAGCSQPAAQPQPAPAPKDETIYIGVGLPLTGSVAQNGQLILNGVKMAVAQFNAKGGLNGKKVDVIAADDKGDPKEAANIANMFVADKRIVAVVGYLKSSCTLAAAPIYNDGKLVAVSPDSSSPKIKDAGPYIYRVKNSDAVNSQTAAQCMIDDGIKRPAIFYENNDYGYGCFEEASKKLKEMNIPVVATEVVMPGESKDFSTAITNLKKNNADGLFLGVDYNESGLIAKQMRAAGVNIPIYGTDGLYTPALVQVGGAAVEGVHVLGSFFKGDPNPIVQQFNKDYKEMYNDESGIGIFSAEGYDTAAVILDAMKRAGSADREAIKKALDQTKDYKAVVGNVTFDADGEVVLPLLRLTIKNGDFVMEEKQLKK
ncbi:MAG: ABC transporter substrate-binding protein [Ignavibacteriales bacterium]